MKRLPSQFVLVFALAVASCFVLFLQVPDGSTSRPEGERSLISFTGAKEDKASVATQDRETRQLSTAEKRARDDRRLSNRPARPLRGNPTLKSWAAGQGSATRAKTRGRSSFVRGSSPTGRPGRGPSGQAVRTQVSSALSELLALQEANHDVETEIPVIIQSHPD